MADPTNIVIPVCETPTPEEQDKILKDIEAKKKAHKAELAALSAPPTTKAEYEAQRRKLSAIEANATKDFNGEKVGHENDLEERKREATRSVTNLVAEVRKAHEVKVKALKQGLEDTIKHLTRDYETVLANEREAQKSQLIGFENTMISEHARLDAEHEAIMKPVQKRYESEITEIREAQKTLDAAYAALAAKKNKSSSGALRDGVVATPTPDVPAESAAAPIKAKGAAVTAMLMATALGGKIG